MQTITFNTEKARIVENAVAEVFGCSVSEILSIKDTLVKKVVVYILFKNKNYNARVLSVNYQISHLYVPTVVVELDYMIKVVPGFDVKIKNVYVEIKNLLD